MIRPQYHLRNSELGLLAWDVRRLIAAAADLAVFEVPLNRIRELDQRFWYDREGDEPTCRSIAEHALLIKEADLSYPIILDPDGRVMDGMHRICKALIEERSTIRAVKLPDLPEPDFIGIQAENLPYEES